MRLPSYLVQSATGVFHFRLMVPRAWRSAVGLVVVKRSLHTRDRWAAQVQALALAAQYAQAFRGSPTMSKPPPLADILAAASSANRFELNTGPGGFVSIKTDGTDRDNAAAHRALEILSRAPVTPAQPASQPVARAKKLFQAQMLWGGYLSKTARRPKTVAIKVTALREFVVWKGGQVPVESIDRTDLAQYTQNLLNSGLQKNTVANKLSYIGDFFRWAHVSGYYAGENPAKGHISVKKADKSDSTHKRGWQPFTDDELRAIFAPDTFTSMRTMAARWGAVLGLYTGARVNELAQLGVADFGTFEGLPTLKITDTGVGQSLKTDASRRELPLHPDLIALGLLELVEAARREGHPRIFPDLTTDAKNGPGNAITTAFSRYLDRLGIVASDEHRVGFHSFRKTVIQTAKAKKVPREAREEYTGHEKAQRNVADEVYNVEYTPAVLAELLFPALRWAQREIVSIEALAPLLRL